MKMVELLHLPKWSDVLIEIYKAPEYKRYCQKINREVKASMNHLRTIVKLLAKEKLIEIIPTHKIHKINMTEKGERIVVCILNIKSELRQNNINKILH